MLKTTSFSHVLDVYCVLYTGTAWFCVNKKSGELANLCCRDNAVSLKKRAIVCYKRRKQKAIYTKL